MVILYCFFQVECSLDYDAGSVRRKTLEILRNLIAKHDCDSRYADPVRIQRSRERERGREREREGEREARQQILEHFIETSFFALLSSSGPESSHSSPLLPPCPVGADPRRSPEHWLCPLHQPHAQCHLDGLLFQLQGAVCGTPLATWISIQQ